MEIFRKNYHLDTKQRAAVIAGTIVIVGIIGWVYEVLFYWMNSGFTTWYWRGAGFGPWIDIYGLGAVLIMCVAGRFKKSPWKVFAVSGILCGVLEYAAGAVIFYTQNGRRPWNYNTEILNFGNIHGFICLRSVLFFAAGGLLVIYVIVPLMSYMTERFGSGFQVLWFVLLALFCADYIYNYIFATLIGPLPSAAQLYDRYLHFNFVKFTNGLLDG